MHPPTWIVGGAAVAAALWAPLAGAQHATQNLPGSRQDDCDIRPRVLQRGNGRRTGGVVR